MQLPLFIQRFSFVKTAVTAVVALTLLSPLMMDAVPVSTAPEQESKVMWDSAHIFRGRLLDKQDTSAAIPDVSIYVANTSLDVVSDADGRFELLLPEELFNKKFTITIEAMGYNPVNVLVNGATLDYAIVHTYLLTESKSQYMNGDIQIIDATK